MGTIQKIRPQDPTTAEQMLGMLMGHKNKLKQIVAVLIWEDDTYQVVKTSMKHSEMAFCVSEMQRHFLNELNCEEE